MKNVDNLRKYKKIVVISIPYLRCVRNILCSKLYQTLKSQKFDLLIVSPVSNNKLFQKEFGGNNVLFLQLQGEKSIHSKLIKRLFSFSELLRFTGYFYKFRKNKKLAYYWFNHISFKSNTNEKNTWLKKSYYYIIGFIGQFKKFWRVCDLFLGRNFFNTKELHEIFRRYDDALIIQQGSWGYQERLLAYYSKKYNTKSLLLPYTTDQVCSNGFLLQNYDFIFAKGEIEKQFAMEFQGVPAEKIFLSGYIWFRSLEEQMLLSDNKKNSNKESVILYAGNSSTYYPRSNELATVDALIDTIKQRKILADKILYRPIITCKEELDEITNRYGDDQYIELDLPDKFYIGLSANEWNSSAKDNIKNYVMNIKRAKIFVMSIFTSMSFDALKLDLPVISNCIDFNKTSFLEETGYHDLLNGDLFGAKAAGMKFCFNLDDLILSVQSALLQPEKELAVKDRLFSQWDYKLDHYYERIVNIIDQCF